jgi:hypothetical protein
MSESIGLSVAKATTAAISRKTLIQSNSIAFNGGWYIIAVEINESS